MTEKLRFTKYACYLGSASQAAVICLSPILFVTFHTQYGISYTLLGMLALFNFFSQLIIDLIFSFFSKKFNIPLTVQITPLITIAGLVLYAVLPNVLPSPYIGIVIGTVIFSVASGLCEVLLSPTIAAIYADNPEREMSKFHSVYAWGVVAVVVISSVFIKIFGTENWTYLALFWTILPLGSALFFKKGEMPDMESGLSSEKSEKGKKKMLGGVLIFVLCIFFGSASENTMTQWCSNYVETVLGFDKFWGDLLGLALYSVMLGIARSLYGKYGKKIYTVMLASFVGASVCYLVAGFSPVPVIGLIACVLCGFFVALMWPGTIIWAENTFTSCGVVVYALLAAGGDFGASVAPQLMGTVTDIVSKSDFIKPYVQNFSLTPEQFGLKVAMVLSTVFSVAGIILVIIIHNKFDRNKKEGMIKSKW